jgi:hypothetical protein
MKNSTVEVVVGTAADSTRVASRLDAPVGTAHVKETVRWSTTPMKERLHDGGSPNSGAASRRCCSMARLNVGGDVAQRRARPYARGGGSCQELMGAGLTEEEEGANSKRLRRREGVINGQDVTILF